jgi:hypothetical protein
VPFLSVVAIPRHRMKAAARRYGTTRLAGLSYDGDVSKYVSAAAFCRWKFRPKLGGRGHHGPDYRSNSPINKLAQKHRRPDTIAPSGNTSIPVAVSNA